MPTSSAADSSSGNSCSTSASCWPHSQCFRSVLRSSPSRRASASPARLRDATNASASGCGRVMSRCFASASASRSSPMPATATGASGFSRVNASSSSTSSGQFVGHTPSASPVSYSIAAPSADSDTQRVSFAAPGSLSRRFATSRDAAGRVFVGIAPDGIIPSAGTACSAASSSLIRAIARSSHASAAGWNSASQSTRSTSRVAPSSASRASSRRPWPQNGS
ncbi:Uncharacterised protein [Burkholderia pseudomallei]|nr:Uncharacterised protein [Burkholderia pseudomallei]